MTESEQLAEVEAFIRFQEENSDYWGDKEDDVDLDADYVFDLEHLKENLKLTVAERLARHDERLRASLEKK